MAMNLSTKVITLVKDINPRPSDSVGNFLVFMNDMIYFVANDGVHGNELWTSDGTTEGTVMVKDIYPGTNYSSSSPSYLTVMNGTLFFRAYTSANGSELWKSDGTDEGTVMVKDINAGTSSSSPSYLANVNVNGNETLFFSATTSANGSELWKSDGTDEGTVMVKDINAGTSSSSPSYLVNVNGNETLFFQAYSARLVMSCGRATVRMREL